MTGGYDIDGKPARKASGNEFAHICKPMVDERGWKQVDEKVLVEVNAQYVPMLLDDAVLVCQRGGIIFIEKVPDVEIEEKKRGSRITYLTEDYMNWLHSAEGSTEFMYHPFRVMSDNDERVTIGHGITFSRLNDGDSGEEERWKILQECFGWTDDDMNDIIDCLFGINTPEVGEVKNYPEDANDPDNKYYTKYTISPAQAEKAFKCVIEDYFAQVNAAINEYEITGHKNNDDIDTNYSQCQLEAMFDVAYNQGVKTDDIVDEDKIIHYYLDLDRPKDTVKAEAVKAVEKFWVKVDKRRRINQMYLFFNEVYNFKENYNEYKGDLGFIK